MALGADTVPGPPALSRGCGAGKRRERRANLAGAAGAGGPIAHQMPMNLNVMRRNGSSVVLVGWLGCVASVTTRQSPSSPEKGSGTGRGGVSWLNVSLSLL